MAPVDISIFDLSPDPKSTIGIEANRTDKMHENMKLELKLPGFQIPINEECDKKSSPIWTIPPEIHTHILSHLPIADQIRASQACKLWKDLLMNTKSLKNNRYKSSAGSILTTVRTHRLLGFAQAYNRSKVPVGETPDGLLFRVEDKKIVECVYYERFDNGNKRKRKNRGEAGNETRHETLRVLGSPNTWALLVSLPDGANVLRSLDKFTGTLSDPTDFLDENLFEPPIDGVDVTYEDGKVSINLYGKKREYVYQMGWKTTYKSCKPPTVREALELILEEAHDHLGRDWEVYRDVSETSA
ncbi:hypothetical protein TWF481_005341 [Arthrobotrys musiformis]|uniref:F-box domain-containing protein n=1 Tax=Arthrobotrys musiformis TaxID=47236 RepID=A0AAV9WFD9_9PEZI